MKTLAFILALFTTFSSFSQTLIRWDFEYENGQSTLQETYNIDEIININPVAYSNLFPPQGSSIFTTGVSGLFLDRAARVRNWRTDTINSSWLQQWIEFRFFNEPGIMLKIDSFSVYIKRNNSGPTRVDFRYHIDSYQNPLDSLIFLASDTSWHKFSFHFNQLIFVDFEQVTLRLYAVNALSNNNGTLTTDSVAVFGQIITQRDLSLKAYLAGPWNGVDMSDSLRSKGLIPLMDPYGFGQTTAPSVLSSTGSNAIVDWVVVGLRSGSDSTLVVSEMPFLLQRDGDIVGLDGTSNPRFLVPSEDYYVYIRHRNHLSVMTNFPVSDTVDFTSPLTPVFGSNSRKVSNGVAMLWEGDVTGNGVIKYVGLGNDRDEILQSVGGSNPNNVVTNVYTPKDVNLDGDIKYTGIGNDRDPILISVGSDTPNAVREEQIP